MTYVGEHVSVLESTTKVAEARFLGNLVTLRQSKLSHFFGGERKWTFLRLITILGKRRRSGREGSSHGGGQRGWALARQPRRIIDNLLVRHVRQAAKVLQLPGRRHNSRLPPRPRARSCLRPVVTILERVCLLLPLCLQEPSPLFLPRKLVPALRRDDAELVLAGLLTSGDELPSQKVGAEEDEGVGGSGARGAFLCRIGL